MTIAHLLAVMILAVGLAMDAMAVAAAKGLGAPKLQPRNALRISLVFGAFQGGMPIIGWAIGARFAKAIEAWDHWIAFVLLGGIGAKMLYEVFSDEQRKDEEASFGFRSLLVLGLATSIDALVAGLTLPLMHVPIAVSATMIGITTAALSAVGVYLGRHFGSRIGRKLDVFGGLLLIGLGTKILIEHLTSRG